MDVEIELRRGVISPISNVDGQETGDPVGMQIRRW